MTTTDDTRTQVRTTAAAPVIPVPRGPTGAERVPGSERERERERERAAAPAVRLRPAEQPTARPVPGPAADDVARPGHGSPAGWILLATAAAGAAWTAGWMAGVSWAWRAMSPRYLRRRHKRPEGAPVGAG